MDQRVQIGGLGVAASLHRFVEEEALPGSGVDPQAFWEGLDAIVHDLAPRNRELLARRDELQSRIDEWHREHPGTPDAGPTPTSCARSATCSTSPADVSVTTSDVDDEVARIAGPQLVVPLLNARFATNAVNARWGSLYDALYGSDVVPREGDLAPGDGYNKVRGDEVIARGRAFLDEHFPLASGSHADASSYAVDDEGLAVTVKDEVRAARRPRPARRLTAVTPSRPRRCSWSTTACTSRSRSTARTRSVPPTGPASRTCWWRPRSPRSWTSRTPSPPSTPRTRSLGYRNWKPLMEGTLAEEVTKGGETFTRSMNPDRTYTTPSGDEVTLSGRSLLFIRQVGHLMTTDAVLDRDGNEVPEGILDAVMTALGSLADLQRSLAAGATRAPGRCTS